MNRIGVATFIIAILAAGLAGAQDFAASPNYGTIRVPGGSAPYPYVVEIIAGGAVDAAGLGPNCRDLISEAPDLRILYSASDLTLALRATSDADTILVVNAPDGSWHCSADGAGGHNPALEFVQPLSGQYDIWVGAKAAGVGWPTRLEVSENSPNWSRAPTFGGVRIVTNVFMYASGAGRHSPIVLGRVRA